MGPGVSRIAPTKFWNGHQLKPLELINAPVDPGFIPGTQFYFSIFDDENMGVGGPIWNFVVLEHPDGRVSSSIWF